MVEIKNNVQTNFQPNITATVSGVKELINNVGQLITDRLPTNQNIDQVIDQVKGTIEQKSRGDVSEKHRRLTDDIVNVLDSSQDFIHSKNENDQLQRFAQEVGDFLSQKVERTANMTLKQIDEANALEEAQELLRTIKEVVLFAITSSDFRALLAQLVEMFQSLVGHQLKKVSRVMQSDLIREDEPLLDFSEHQDVETLNSETKNRIKRTFRQILSTIADSEEYGHMVHKIFDIVTLVETFSAKLVENPIREFKTSTQFYQLLETAKDIIATFCGPKDFNSFNKQFWSLVEDIRTDQSTSEYFSELYSFVVDCLEDPELLINDSQIDEADHFVERAIEMISVKEGKYHEQFSILFDTMWALIQNVTKDEINMRLQGSISDLSRDLLLNSDGKLDFHVVQESIMALKDIILPIMKDRLQNITIPRIEGSNDAYDYILEDVSFDALELFPDHFNIRVFSDIEVDLSNSQKDRSVTVIDMKANNIKLAFNGVKFAYKRKNIPRIEDSGELNAEIAGDGLEFGIRWKAVHNRGESLEFNLSSVKCKIDQLNIQVLDSQHKIIDGIVSYVFSGYIKKMVAEKMVEKIREVLSTMQDQLNVLFKKHERSFRKDLQVTRLAKYKARSRKSIQAAWDLSEVKSKFFNNIGFSHEYLESGEEDSPLLEREDVQFEPEVSIDAFDLFDQSKDTFTQLIESRNLKGASGGIYSESLDVEELSSPTMQAQTEDNWDFQWNDMPYRSLLDEDE